MNNDEMKFLLSEYAASKQPVLVRFRDDPAPAGPGHISETKLGTIFRFDMPIQVEGRRGILPILFRVGDALWISTGAIDAEPERSQIITPGRS